MHLHIALVFAGFATIPTFSFLFVDSYVTLNFKTCFEFRIHLLSRQRKTQYCTDKLDFFFSPTLPSLFLCYILLYIRFEKLLYHYFI